MAAQAQPPPPQSKVLRIGIVQDGKIVQERLIKEGEPVTVGESTKNTFVLPPGDLPKRFSLFVPKGGKGKGNGYVLQFSEEMRGKISYRNAIITLKQLREQGKASRKGAGYVLPLSEGYRGKVAIGKVTVLFQFVPPPPEIATGAKMDFRPRLIEDDDPVFLGFLALFTALACVLLVFVYTHEPIESRGIQEIPDRFTEIVLDPPEDVEVPEIEEAEADGEEVVKTEETPEQEAAEQEAEEAAEDMTEEEAEVAEAERQEQLEEEVLQESKLLMALIGTRGETNNGSRVEDLFGDGDNFSQDLDAALKNVSGAEVASGANLELKGGEGVGTENADIGDLAKAKGGGSNVGEGPATNVEGKVGTGAVDMIAGEGDGASIQKVVRKYIGQVKYCYEGRLKENPDLAGRVEVQIIVSRGRVQSVDLIGNTTGDASLGSCITRKIHNWRFPSDTDADFVYPFALSQ